MAHYELNVKKLVCPMPLLKTQAKIKQLQKGDILKVIATDPGVKHDIPSWCRIHGHKLVSIDEQGGEIILTIQVQH